MASNVNKVLLSQPRGFCAGVEMAIKALGWMVRVFEAPVYCYHEIVHNQLVVERFKKLGVVFVDDINEVPFGYPLMLSAHGSAPEVVKQAQEKGGVVINAVCPLVTKVHHEVKVRAKNGYKIIYVGHKGHDEALGTVAVAPESIELVERVEEVSNIEKTSQPIALLSQTTLAQREWSEILDEANKQFGTVWTAGKSDLCFATTNRQGALEQVAIRSDAVIVIGSPNSSNTLALEKLAKESGCKNVYRIDGPDELPLDLEGIVGVTAGASAPQELIDGVIEKLNPLDGIEVVDVTIEDEYFPPPRELRDLVKILSGLLSLGIGKHIDSSKILGQDRNLNASEVIQTLA